MAFQESWLTVSFSQSPFGLWSHGGLELVVVSPTSPSIAKDTEVPVPPLALKLPLAHCLAHRSSWAWFKWTEPQLILSPPSPTAKSTVHRAQDLLSEAVTRALWHEHSLRETAFHYLIKDIEMLLVYDLEWISASISAHISDVATHNFMCS